MANPNQNINQGKKDLKEVADIVGVLDDGFQSLADRITGVVDAMSEASSEARNFDRISRDINSTLNAISRQNEKSIRNQIELNSGQLASKKSGLRLAKEEIRRDLKELQQQLKQLEDETDN
jgi:methyl-accepting chemotaxis protein